LRIVQLAEVKMDFIPISQEEAYRVNMDGGNISMEFWNQD
jgi:hypothetical protein